MSPVFYDLSNIIDLHVHNQPDITPQRLIDIEACKAAKAAGLKG